MRIVTKWSTPQGFQGAVDCYFSGQGITSFMEHRSLCWTLFSSSLLVHSLFFKDNGVKIDLNAFFFIVKYSKLHNKLGYYCIYD
jgi:hypothetical protein